MDQFNYIGEFQKKEFHGKGRIYFKSTGFFEGDFFQGVLDQNK